MRNFILGGLVLSQFFLGICSWGAVSPEKDLFDLQEKPLKIAPDTNQVLLIFWATWCPDCKEKITEELPKLKAQGKLPPGLSVILVATEKDQDRVSHFIEKEHVSFLVASDRDKKWRQELKLFSVPAWATLQKNAGAWIVKDSGSGFEKEKLNASLGKAIF